MNYHLLSAKIKISKSWHKYLNATKCEWSKEIKWTWMLQHRVKAEYIYFESKEKKMYRDIASSYLIYYISKIQTPTRTNVRKVDFLKQSSFSSLTMKWNKKKIFSDSSCSFSFLRWSFLNIYSQKISRVEMIREL